MKRLIFGLINHLGERLPKRVQRVIADFPGILTLLEKLSSGAVEDIVTPEGHTLEINTLFHSNLVKNASLAGYAADMRRAITRLTQPGFTAYDIGANVGVFSFLFLSLVGKQGHVYAFEPEPNNSDCLGHSIVKSSVENITLDKRAIGEKVETAMFDRRGGAFSGRLIINSAKYNPTYNIIEVKTTTLDKLVSEENYRSPDIVKIDVEGNETLVLSGMTHIFEKNPPIIICELHSHLGDSVDEVAAILKKYNYHIYAIADFLELPAVELQEIVSLRDARHVVALPAKA